ncbi:hypothetical protein DICPUDRAFT_156484 [Dictyostelium purpureum]|uniref:2-hydroxyacyl-CoA lyase n=1 Tax=Dictyostelium purpureum TaxID=5786 RepID=F0ZWP6_DICPU|nr:uncharacterized protein DICPUDRAFT_156484 [Dictyostelium purpureum]EGC31644.1 hypothetical protein DICPUDRAFT_156484 [Dictyostelium purpureum]|eukprot:XP_003291842.1 hypothetical protein DICPUDRAFT_156484 [Dictyostelium purpureum]
MDGVEIIAKSIKNSAIEKVFGIVGVPITPIAYELQKQGVGFFGFRNEQSCSYAASIVGYLTGLPGLCMTVSGPGMVHALAGVLNAQSNGWPLILMSSSISLNEIGKGGFQESKQMELAEHYCKKVYNVTEIDHFPEILKDAIETSLSNRPGPVYIQLPSNIIKSKGEANIREAAGYGSIAIKPILPDINKVKDAVELLINAKRPLVIGGKGAAYCRCENELLEFIETTKIPFLPSPMGKGLLRDDHPLVVGAARSYALKNADVVLVLGARLNWMFGFGKAPVFSPSVQFIVVDVDQNEAVNNPNVKPAVSIVGDARLTIAEMRKLIGDSNSMALPLSIEDSWWVNLKADIEVKTKSLMALMNEPQINDTDYLNYHKVYNSLRSFLFQEDSIFVNEGANTMDIGRICINQSLPRSRLDAGTLATMGVGVGYAIAAQICFPSRPVVCVQGDSAFGFSAMEMEVAVRYHLPIVFIVLNNNGVYEGLESMSDDKYTCSTESASLHVPPTSLLVDVQYEKIMQSFGGSGYSISTLSYLNELCQQIKNKEIKLPVLLNIKIKPTGTKPKIVH